MQAHERKLFEQAMVPHIDAAFNLARWLTQDAHAAEDVVQESYLRAARYFHSFHGGDGRPWLLGIVRRTAFDWLGKYRSEAIASYNDETHDRGDDSMNPASLAIREDEQQSVRSALEDLPPQLREAIVLRELEGLSYQEIATVAQVPIGTVMSRISRGRRQLQQRLAGSSQEKLP